MISIFIRPEVINIVCLVSAVIIYMFQEIFSTSFKLSNLLILIIVPNILFMFEEFVAICFFRKNSNSSLSLFFLPISLDRSFQRTSHLFTLMYICLWQSVVSTYHSFTSGLSLIPCFPQHMMRTLNNNGKPFFFSNISTQEL